MDLKLGEHIHWFLTYRCNMKCPGCFREYFPKKESTKNLTKLATTLAENNVKRVTIGGGEPTLVKGLLKILPILKDAGIFVDLHTNCMTLFKERLEGLQGLVDKIGIPIDSLDDVIQTELRGVPGYVKLVKKVAKNAEKLGFKIVYHTVATDSNINKIPEIYYRFIGKTNFDCWKVYEFNEDLAMQNNFCRPASSKAKVERHHQIMDLHGHSSSEKGGTDGLLARFLLMDEKMKKKYNDERIKFICKRDYSDSYFFLNNTGDAEFYTWFSEKRMKIGNILEDDFPLLVKKFRKLDEEGWPGSSVQFFGALNELPIFARLCDGAYDWEELENIQPKYHDKVVHLAQLWEMRRFGEIYTTSLFYFEPEDSSNAT